MSNLLTFETTSDWPFSIEITKQEAQNLIDASNWNTIPLGGGNETLTIEDDEIRYERKITNGGCKNEYLVKSKMLKKLKMHYGIK